jgi:hypothetical protein
LSSAIWKAPADKFQTHSPFSSDLNNDTLSKKTVYDFSAVLTRQLKVISSGAQVAPLQRRARMPPTGNDQLDRSMSAC